jgi:hypothetical protein
MILFFSFFNITLVMRNPKRTSHYMMTCSKIIFKHLKKCYQTKINGGKVATWFSIFCKSNDFFLLKKTTSGVFECFQSHCHILKKLHEFLHMMSARITFEKNSFIFSFVSYGLTTKSLEARCTFERIEEKTKCQKMNVKFLKQN